MLHVGLTSLHLSPLDSIVQEKLLLTITYHLENHLLVYFTILPFIYLFTDLLKLLRALLFIACDTKYELLKTVNCFLIDVIAFAMLHARGIWWETVSLIDVM